MKKNSSELPIVYSLNDLLSITDSIRINLCCGSECSRKFLFLDLSLINRFAQQTHSIVAWKNYPTQSITFSILTHRDLFHTCIDNLFVSQLWAFHCFISMNVYRLTFLFVFVKTKIIKKKKQNHYNALYSKNCFFFYIFRIWMYCILVCSTFSLKLIDEVFEEYVYSKISLN